VLVKSTLCGQKPARSRSVRPVTRTCDEQGARPPVKPQPERSTTSCPSRRERGVGLVQHRPSRRSPEAWRIGSGPVFVRSTFLDLQRSAPLSSPAHLAYRDSDDVNGVHGRRSASPPGGLRRLRPDVGGVVRVVVPASRPHRTLGTRDGSQLVRGRAGVTHVGRSPVPQVAAPRHVESARPRVDRNKTTRQRTVSCRGRHPGGPPNHRRRPLRFSTCELRRIAAAAASPARCCTPRCCRSACLAPAPRPQPPLVRSPTSASAGSINPSTASRRRLHVLVPSRA
jgi:hypothetical protein